MEIYTLAAQPRIERGRAAARLRAAGLIPGIVYGHGFKPQSVAVPRIPFEKLYRAAGESSLVDLMVEGGGAIKVLIADTQRDPLRDNFIHIDFYAVRMDEKLEADINLKFVGEAAAVKELGGTLVKNVSHLKVRCLPGALVHDIEVDLGRLKTFEDKIHVRDLVIPAGIEVLSPPIDETVVLVAAPRTEEEMKALQGAPEAPVAEVKVIAEEKKAEREEKKATKEE